MSRRMPVWRGPLLMAALSVCGLLAALLGGPAWRWPACAALAIPVVVGTWWGLRPRVR